MRTLIITLVVIAWWAISIGGYFTFKHGSEIGLYKPEARYNGNTDRWLKEALIAACCGFGLPLYFVFIIAWAWKHPSK